jgi:hypothetical protein
MVYSAGSSSFSGYAAGEGGGHVGGGMFFGIRHSNLAQQVAPPPAPNLVGLILVWLVAIPAGLIDLLYLSATGPTSEDGSINGSIVFLIVLVVTVAFFHYSLSSTHKKELAQWNVDMSIWRSKYLCQRCGTIFIATEEGYQGIREEEKRLAAIEEERLAAINRSHMLAEARDQERQAQPWYRRYLWLGIVGFVIVVGAGVILVGRDENTQRQSNAIVEAGSESVQSGPVQRKHKGRKPQAELALSQSNTTATHTDAETTATDKDTDAETTAIETETAATGTDTTTPSQITITPSATPTRTATVTCEVEIKKEQKYLGTDTGTLETLFPSATVAILEIRTELVRVQTPRNNQGWAFRRCFRESFLERHPECKVYADQPKYAWPSNCVEAATP